MKVELETETDRDGDRDRDRARARDISLLSISPRARWTCPRPGRRRNDDLKLPQNSFSFSDLSGQFKLVIGALR